MKSPSVRSTASDLGRLLTFNPRGRPKKTNSERAAQTREREARGADREFGAARVTRTDHRHTLRIRDGRQISQLQCNVRRSRTSHRQIATLTNRSEADQDPYAPA